MSGTPSSGASLGRGEEFDRIRRILAGAPSLPPGVLLGPGDDAAVFEPDLVVSTDMALEGVHFRLGWITPAEAGHRATAAALSDLAAMAARVVGVLASVAAPAGSSSGEELMAGVRAEVEARGGLLLGGDLSRSPGPLCVDVVAVGRARLPLLRSGARVGDELWVTGTLGGAAAAVALWKDGRTPPDALKARFVAPTPRLEEILWLVEHVDLHAGIDLSDGLAGDAGHLAAASGVEAQLEADALPVDPALVAVPGVGALPSGLEAQDLALHGGEDYEMLFAVPSGAVTSGRVEKFRRQFDLTLSRVGRIRGGSGVTLVPPGGGAAVPVTRGGYDHFAGGEAER